MDKYGYNQNNVNKSGSDEYPSEKEINNSNQTPLNQSEAPSPEQLIKEHNDYLKRLPKNYQIEKEEDNMDDDSYDSDDSHLCDDCNGCGCRECCCDCLNGCKSECADCCYCDDDGDECCRCLNGCNCNCSNSSNLGLLFFCCFCR